MKRKTECVELQSRMVEYFADPPRQIPAAIAEHLKDCEECQLEFAQMQKVLTHLEDASEIYEAVPEHLFSGVESQLDSVQQLRPAIQSAGRIRNLLILQYSYLSAMAVIIWLSLLLVQPMLTGWLAENELVSSLAFLNDYGLFLIFFAAGGLFAMISSPLIIKTALRQPAGEKKFNLLRRLFSVGMRTFAC
ncbi:MAG: hypothetical protein CVV42_16835 [Candidatus Riflebacteria bacterium HGW-Riflebacteria-2]|jgi:hypothetical protein|nr:MAG: hypothetical protein CVV42_16835 [Candidatus Riflebacteria bacterium HGW-Riflebacteria-2]